MTHYVGVLDGSGDVWGVRIPDIPGCVGGGATAEAAIADAGRPCAMSSPQAQRRLRDAPPLNIGGDRGVRRDR